MYEVRSINANSVWQTFKMFLFMEQGSTGNLVSEKGVTSVSYAHSESILFFFADTAMLYDVLALVSIYATARIAPLQECSGFFFTVIYSQRGRKQPQAEIFMLVSGHLVLEMLNYLFALLLLHESVWR
jgi:hypothetical protein